MWVRIDNRFYNLSQATSMLVEETTFGSGVWRVEIEMPGLSGTAYLGTAFSSQQEAFDAVDRLVNAQEASLFQ